MSAVLHLPGLRPFRRCGLLLAITITVAPSHCSAQDPAAWSNAVHGLRLGVTLEQKSTSTNLRILLENVGASRYNLLIGGNQGSGNTYSFRFFAIAPDGQRYPLDPIDAAYYSSGGFIHPITAEIEPGQHREFAFPVRQLVYFTKTGNISLATWLNHGYGLQVSLEIEALVEPINQICPCKVSRVGRVVTPELLLTTTQR